MSRHLRTTGTASTSGELMQRAYRLLVVATSSLTLGLGLVPAQAAPAPTPVATTLALSAPASVVDGRSVTLTARWRTSPAATDAASAPVAQGTVTFQQRVGERWRDVGSRRTDSAGVARLAVTPRTDSSWRAVGVAGAGWRAAVSGVSRVDNRPPGTPVALPAGAPSPRALPAQARAAGSGANAVVRPIPRKVWRSMVGRSWRQGCPVGRGGLRLVRVNYWGFDGYRYRGEVVLSTAVARRAAAALSDMHAAQLPLRRMYRVDRFGFSKRLNGADDYASMATDNTSGFNCRWVVGRPGIRSPHASGRSIDLNPWENPYRASHGWTPHSWWVGRSHPRVAWRGTDHPVVRIWRKHGFRWTYGVSDAHHYDGRSAGPTQGSFVG